MTTKISRFTIRTLGLIAVFGLWSIGSSLFAQCAWDPVVQALSVKTDARSKRAAANLTHICTTIRAADIQASPSAKKCLGSNASLFTETDANLLKKAFGTISSSTLKKWLPTVAALLGGTAAASITLFLTPQEIGKDAIDVISNPDRYSKDDLIKASRQLLWDTEPQAFRDGLSVPRKAAIAGCIVAQ
jgi:hypothetical protein